MAVSAARRDDGRHSASCTSYSPAPQGLAVGNFWERARNADQERVVDVAPFDGGSPGSHDVAH